MRAWITLSDINESIAILGISDALTTLRQNTIIIDTENTILIKACMSIKEISIYVY